MAEWTEIALVAALGSALSWLSLRYKFPNAVAQVLLGVLLGTAILGWVPHSPLLHYVGVMGVVLLLGAAGLKLRIGRLKAAGLAGVAVAAVGIALSVGGGFAVADRFGFPVDEALYVGLALGATSIGITVQVLEQFGLIGHRVADVLIAAAVIDDVVVLYLLGAAHGFLSDGISAAETAGYILLAGLVLAGLFLVSRAATRAAYRCELIRTRLPRAVWALACIAFGAILTQSLDLSLVVGAFFAGVGVGEGMPHEASEHSAAKLQPLVLLLMPFFFIMIGVQADLDILDVPGMRWFVVILIVTAVAGKAIGGVIGALRDNGWRDRWLIGFGMVARGEVCLIIATLGFELGHVSRPVFVSLVLMTITVAALGPLLMAPLAKRAATAVVAGGTP